MNGKGLEGEEEREGEEVAEKGREKRERGTEDKGIEIDELIEIDEIVDDEIEKKRMTGSRRRERE